MKPSLLLLTDWFPPAYKAGGPIRSCANIASALSGHWEVWVLTGDRDLGDIQPFASVPLNCWEAQEDGVKVFRAAQGSLQRDRFRQLLRQANPQAVYLNSMFSLTFSIRPMLWLRKDFPNVKVVLAPRGMLKQSALAFKTPKKKAYLFLARLLGWHQNVHFHATDTEEKRSIQHFFGNAAQITQIGNLPAPVGDYPQKPNGVPHFIFVGRIHPIKGLDTALRALQYIEQPLVFTILGNVEDTRYFQLCRALAEGLPANISVHWQEGMANTQVQQLLQQHHFFLLPTYGENFGHAIFEAFAAGTPVLISDQTPWRELERQKIGWDLPLSAPEAWHKAIQSAVDMDEATYQDWSRAAHGFAQRYFAEQDLVGRYLALFRD